MKSYPWLSTKAELIATIEPFLPYFPDIPDLLIVEEFAVGDKIVDSFSEIRHLRCLVEGKAKITLVHDNGRESIVDFLRTGDYIGELTLLEIEKQPKDVIAISSCICLSVSIESSKHIIEKDPEFLLRMSRFLAAKHLRRTWYYVKGMRYEVKNRLAAYILLTENQGVYRQKHTETADFLNVSYRHLLHTISQFLDDGTLTKEGRSYRINREALEDLAGDINYE